MEGCHGTYVRISVGTLVGRVIGDDYELVAPAPGGGSRRASIAQTEYFGANRSGNSRPERTIQGAKRRRCRYAASLSRRQLFAKSTHATAAGTRRLFHGATIASPTNSA